MSHQLDSFLAQLPDVQTVGEAPSAQDLYGLIDQVTAHVASCVPSVACRAGCIACCSSELPAVTSLEWRVLYRHVLTLPEETQARIRQMAALLRPLQPVLARHRALMMAESDEVGQTPALQCPFLIDGGCSVYAHRGLVCRTYGYFGATVGGQTGFFGCVLASSHLQQVAPRGFELPRVEPYKARMRELNEAVAPSTWAYFPQWLWAHLDDAGAFVPEAIWAPDFGEAPPPSARRRLPPNPRLRRGQ
jgi:Fe-S-cluster containining protein